MHAITRSSRISAIMWTTRLCFSNWTVPSPPALAACPAATSLAAPTFHGYILEAFSILQGKYGTLSSHECAENLKTSPTTGDRVATAGPNPPCKCVLQHICFTDACSLTHSPCVAPIGHIDLQHLLPPRHLPPRPQTSMCVIQASHIPH